MSLILASLLVCLLSPSTVKAQYTFFNPPEAFAIEVSLPNTNLIRLPIDRNSISSLTSVGSYIIGGTSAAEGKAPFLFTASLTDQKMINVYDLESFVTQQQSITSGFCTGASNTLYVGTLPSEGSSNSGHLLSISLGKDGDLTIEDVGTPILGEGILALTINSEKNILFGISYPSGYFFTFDLQNYETAVYDNLLATKEQLSTYRDFALAPNQYLCKALIADEKGLIYGSAPINRIFLFNPMEKSFSFLEKPIPAVWGRETMGAVESWTKSKEGLLYAGISGDGQLIEINPNSKQIKNLGKPIMMNRLRGLTYGADGKIYGIAGSAPGYAHLFSYDTREGFKDLGNPEFKLIAPGIEQGINWRGFQLGTITTSDDGKYIIMGEDESLSQLLVFPVDH
jgi:hypothetical protein